MTFRFRVEDATLDDLHRRLDAVRWPQGVLDSGGVPIDELKRVIDYWRNTYDWRAQERELNELPQHREELDGVHLHFIHIPAVTASATPLLLLHGWPGSFVEMRTVIPLLRDHFHLIIPSLPGYGFSSLPPNGGFSNARIAELFLTLMSTLGYQNFAVQGGDWGAGIGTWMALKSPERVIGLHLNYIPGSYSPEVITEPTAEERVFFRSRDQWIADSGAYGHVQKTRPLTLGYALSDSPAGLCAWIYEKFVEWCDPDTLPTLDDILTNISIYWFTNSIASSMRLYLESTKTPLAGQHVSVPTAILRCRHEAPFPPRSWIERGYNVVRFTEVPRGGHFAAMEVPELFAQDVREFLSSAGPRRHLREVRRR